MGLFTSSLYAFTSYTVAAFGCAVGWYAGKRVAAAADSLLCFDKVVAPQAK